MEPEIRCYTIGKINFLPAVEIVVNKKSDELEIIQNNEQDFVAVDQIYKSKRTIVHVMKRYALLRGFQFTTTRYTPIRYEKF